MKLKDGDTVDYIRDDGTVYEGCVMRVGDRHGLVKTIWFEPEPGKVKYVHWVPEQSDNTRTRCWRRK